MQFLIIHGSFGSPDENWIPWLKSELIKLGHSVIVPKFPVDDWDELTAKGETTTTTHQTLNNWLDAFEPFISKIRAEPTVVIAHSLGPLFILHAIEKYSLTFDCGIFVAPFLEKLHTNWQIDAANQTFYQPLVNPTVIPSSINVSYALYSDNDPYVKFRYTKKFIDVTQSQSIVIKGGGHLSASSGYTKLPLVLDLCTSRI